ncbi:MAG: flagellar motor switch protein FliN [Opitutae bacterium]|jgi:flagellar motor switch protein FliN/FliY|nr:flagellar motor switch protein FliN [Opitutae bacterium]|tara:strand:+ start:3465 stop:3713 length:249 start_codon:yes stop_codon:yes gene_type:complete
MNSEKMDIVMDVKVNVTVQLGTAQLPMREVVELSPGAIIQLKQQAKDPVGLLVNGKLIAHGEVVVVEDKFGLKITEILDSPT